jgi:hypothetical protein
MTVPEANPYDPELPFFACQRLRPDQIGAQEVVFRQRAELPCTPTRLFEIFEDPTSWPRWAPGIGQVIWTSPKPFSVGTTRTVVFWGGARVYEVFDAWEPGRELSFSFVGTSEEIWSAFGEHYLVTPTVDGCRVDWTVGYVPAGRFARIHPYIYRLMRWNLGSYMWWLRRYVRAHPG